MTSCVSLLVIVGWLQEAEKSVEEEEEEEETPFQPPNLPVDPQVHVHSSQPSDFHMQDQQNQRQGVIQEVEDTFMFWFLWKCDLKYSVRVQTACAAICRSTNSFTHIMVVKSIQSKH